MKKGIVMEKHRDYIIVMQKDGAFQKAWPLKNAAIGMEVSYQPFPGKWRYSQKKYIFQMAAIACLLLILMPIYFMMDKDRTYAYVNISINPNIELAIDDHLNVKSIVPLNEDAESFLPKLTDYEGDSLENVMEKIITASEEANLLQNGKNMLAGVNYIRDTHQVSVTKAIDDYFLDHDQGWGIVTFQIPNKIRKQAQESEQSMNQLMARSLVESESSTSGNEGHAAEEPPVDEDDREILNIFYNENNNHSGSPADENRPNKREQNVLSDEKASEQSDQTVKSVERHDEETPNSRHESKHPSDLKSENAERNGYGQERQNETSVHKNAGGDDRHHGKGKGHDKPKQHNGKAKGDKAKPHNGHHKQNNGKASGQHTHKHHNSNGEGHEKVKQHNGKKKGHHKGKNGRKNNGKGPK
ncbi:anti-sigma-I factor RsgI family protein [Lentibacillus salicampi]|uniref:RsgI N-terminal anti-sigma domain-containing protein n=1 Tax=Lentibacillus salicampi TaxID=175306 RepID=A0A4Y9ADH7_9BACI|nr:anti-sigma factor domain-containing protein [Lentibacillus salicampi]TFJ93485.1 hypothetical protein E4U82_05860 [Lentibacillus salicampi]